MHTTSKEAIGFDERTLVNTDTRKARIEIGVALLEASCKN